MSSRTGTQPPLLRPTLGNLQRFPYQNDTLCQHSATELDPDPPFPGLAGLP